MIDTCVESTGSDGMRSEKARAHGDYPSVYLQKWTDPPRFCIDYRNTTNKFLERETWPMPDIESYIDTKGGAKFITAKYRARTGKHQ